MKTLFAVCSLIGVLTLGWHYRELAGATEVAQGRLAAVNKELEMAHAKIAELNKSKPTLKPNWIAERTLDWQSPLARGAYDKRHAVTIMPPPPFMPPPPVAPTPPGFRRPSDSQTRPDTRNSPGRLAADPPTTRLPTGTTPPRRTPPPPGSRPELPPPPP